MFRNNHRPALFALVLLIMISFACIQKASAQAWDSTPLLITPPTKCTTGEAVSACPVTGYRIETSTTGLGPWTSVVSLPATQLTYTATGLSAGQHCFQAFALSAQGDSPSSIVYCRTNVKPAGPPAAPGLSANQVAAYRAKTSNGLLVRGNPYGSVAIGASCDASRCTSDSWCVISDNKNVWPKISQKTAILGHCG